MKIVKTLCLIVIIFTLGGCRSEEVGKINPIGEVLYGKYISFDGGYPDDKFLNFDYWPEYCGHHHFYNEIEIKKDGHFTLTTVFANKEGQIEITRRVLEGELFEDPISNSIYINDHDNLTRLDMLTSGNLLFVRFNSDKPKEDYPESYYIYHYQNNISHYQEDIGSYMNDLVTFWQENGLQISKDQNVPFFNIRYIYSPDFTFESGVINGIIPDFYSLNIYQIEDELYEITFYNKNTEEITHSFRCTPALIFHDEIWLEIITDEGVNPALLLRWRDESFSIVPYLWETLQKQYPMLIHP